MASSVFVDVAEVERVEAVVLDGFVLEERDGGVELLPAHRASEHRHPVCAQGGRHVDA